MAVRKKIKKKCIVDWNIFEIIVRYSILIILGLDNLWIFYFIFTPLTIYPVLFLFRLFFDAFLWQNTIFVNGYIIDLVESCIAGAAYYFLLILNLTTRGIKIIKRIKVFLFSIILFLFLNIIRIFLLGVLKVKNLPYFDISHTISWYIISTLYVVMVWVISIKIFKINNIPFYSDFMFLKKRIPNKRLRKR